MTKLTNETYPIVLTYVSGECKTEFVPSHKKTDLVNRFLDEPTLAAITFGTACNEPIEFTRDQINLN